MQLLAFVGGFMRLVHFLDMFRFPSSASLHLVTCFDEETHDNSLIPRMLAHFARHLSAASAFGMHFPGANLVIDYNHRSVWLDFYGLKDDLSRLFRVCQGWSSTTVLNMASRLFSSVAELVPRSDITRLAITQTGRIVDLDLPQELPDYGIWWPCIHSMSGVRTLRLAWKAPHIRRACAAGASFSRIQLSIDNRSIQLKFNHMVINIAHPVLPATFSIEHKSWNATVSSMVSITCP
ncbi:hypothetical protein K488DRAFT_87899 [Vararia minispora EC-137]|uniref:Uncharacterized protein n=1 Tax=Vararia minispora EC-137 TaxID=1314806 RepID=A0ACB8QG56_9AGAM|nr:hypothetical protein K488DRAFT_87899 [Vararia minispora EC-137]